MEAILLALIQQLNAAVFVLLALLILGFWSTYKIGGVVTYFTETKGKQGAFDTKIDTMKDSLASIKATTDLLYQVHLKTVQTASPLSLTAIGKETSTAISAKQKIDEHWTDIQNEIEKKAPKNPYDVQVVSLDIAQRCYENIFTATERDHIKTYAYTKGMNLLEVYPVIGIEIRDKYMEEKKMLLEDIDKHDPKNQQF